MFEHAKLDEERWEKIDKQMIKVDEAVAAVDTCLNRLGDYPTDLMQAEALGSVNALEAEVDALAVLLGRLR